MDKQIVVLLSNKKEWTIDLPNNLDGYQRCYAEEKKQVSKDYILYDSFIWHYQKDVTIVTENGYVVVKA